jgi:polyhydroxybutyrate depolymerase
MGRKMSFDGKPKRDVITRFDAKWRWSVGLLITCIALQMTSFSLSADAEQHQRMARRTIHHDGIEREYFVHVPTGVDGKLPVVVGVHGYTSTATGFAAAHGLNQHADANGYIVVYPQGSHFLADDPQGQSYRVTSWNDLAANLGPKQAGPHCTADSDYYPCPPECGECNRCGWTSCYDDVGFIEKMLDAMQSEFQTDSSRYYLLGVSNGGMMTLRLGCNLGDRFAAIAPIIGQLAPGYECGPDVDLPMLHLFGGEDNTVRFDGKPGGDGFIYSTAAETVAVWSSKMACKTGPSAWKNEISESAGLACTAYSDCRVAGHEVVSCMDPDGVHAWPEQYVAGMPATCVTSEQYDSLPGQSHCQSPSGEYIHLGMDLIWEFMTRYRTGN